MAGQDAMQIGLYMKAGGMTRAEAEAKVRQDKIEADAEARRQAAASGGKPKAAAAKPTNYLSALFGQ